MKGKRKPDEDNLIPPDLDRCQAEKLDGSFMTLGPRSMVRCKNKPTYIATENKPGPDGKRGSMSLCGHCSKMFKEKMGENFAAFTPIEEKPCLPKKSKPKRKK